MSTLTKFTGLLALIALVSIGCPEKKADGDAPKDDDKPATKDDAKTEDDAKTDDPKAAAATVGTNTLKGAVAWNGDAPERKKLKREADPVCGAKEMLSEVTLVNGGKLQNVVVYVTGKGLPTKEVGGAVKVSQVDCMYRPRVQCGQKGQEIVVSNPDKTMHNVHGYKADGKTWFNQAQMGGAPPIKKKFKDGGALYSFKCDVHPWMAGYVFSTDNGYCAVTGEDGSFSIEGLPAGTFTVTAWHEKWGQKTAEVTIEDGKPAEANFTYSQGEG